MAVSVIYSVSVASALGVQSTAQPPGTAASWVVNCDTGAHVQYDNYNFSSFCKFNGLYYGIKADGLYLLQGATDAGLPIHSAIVTAVTDLGLAQVKSCSAVYVGGSGTGSMRIQVMAKGLTYTYVSTPPTTFAGWRTKIGRGIRSKYWQFGVYNVGGAAFQIDEMAVYPVKLRRREM